jgi:hypothetical protein
MGVAVSLIIAAVGLVLALAVHPTNPGSIDVNTVGWILFVVGLVGFVIDLVLWSSWGPGYRRGGAVVDDAYVRRPAYRPRRRTVVEEVDDPGAPPL